eukprot:TRINITY_DN6918_c0_g1_i1.p1 TRINITY_DN6918_c0_g1~~TRINITY_DN6918_c0_g1_i1.p1  ORF type:complete len:113 (+),score=46.48 TRINITY_DN6918_c0_g1_i1:56-394(+)
MSWTQPCSLTAVKYQRYGVVESKPFLPGERLSVAREMERNVKGFKEVRRELALARRMVEQQEQMRKDSTKDKVIQTSFYKSVVGTRSSKGSGAIFHTNPVARIGFFSSTKRV